MQFFEQSLASNLAAIQQQQPPPSPEAIAIQADLNAQLFENVSKAVCKYKKTIDGRDPLENSDAYPFLIIFDEASVLSEVDSVIRLSTLTSIRRAFHWFDGNPASSILLVSLGTNSDVSTFYSAISADSLRFPKRSNLLPPFVLTGNWDIFLEELQLHRLVVNGELIRNHRTCLLLYTFGRALWSSVYLPSLQILARQKLLNGAADLFEAHMAIWCIRSGLTVNYNLILTKTLLKSYMATLISVNYDTSNLYVGYSCEPALAMAAREIVHTSNTSTKAFFESLLRYVQGVPVDKGRIAEAIFTEFILQAIDKAPKILTHSQDNPRGNNNKYLKAIYGSNDYILKSWNPDLPERQIFTRSLSVGSVGSDNSDSSVRSVRSVGSDTSDSSVRSVRLVGSVGSVGSIGSVGSGTVEEEQASPSVNDQDPVECVLEKLYRVITVENFLRRIYGDKYDKIASVLPRLLLAGFINCSQFVQLSRNFPFRKAFGRNSAGIDNISLPDASGSLKKNCNVIDKALLRNGILRQVGYIMPANYYAFDMIIPVLLEIKSGCSRKLRTVYTFIGIQSKAGEANVTEVMMKMEAGIH